MASKNLYLRIFTRCGVILLASLASGWLIFGMQNYILGGLALLVAIISFFEMISFLNAMNRKIAFFFEAVANEDSSLNFPRRSGNKVLNDLNRSLDGLNEMMKKVLIEQQQQEQYFQTILEQVPIGVITYNSEGLIFLANGAAKKLLNYEHLTHIKQLERVDPLLYKSLLHIKPGDRTMARIRQRNGEVQLALKSTLFRTFNNSLQLVTVQDIRQEMEKTEQDSWIKLIRVLTHEIMNTISPITSLSESLLQHYQSGNPLSDKTVNSTVKGLEVINDRGKGLISFVDSYRKLTRLPEPVKKPLGVKKLLEKTIMLINMEQDAAGIPLEVQVIPDNLEIVADEKQISQVLINLCKNSLEALEGEDQGKISLLASINRKERPQIEVSDNGCGIPDNILDEIFVPFFTTKEAGSGIGLSLSRQIMQMHGGNLSAHSVPGKTSMVMVF